MISFPSIDINYYINSIINYIISYFPNLLDFLRTIFGYFLGICIILSIFLLFGIIYCVEKLKKIRQKEEAIYHPKVEIAYEEKEKGDPELSRKWEKVKQFIESDNENDWRQSIIQADIILGDLLTKMGYKGEGIGEQLRRVEKADFDTLDQAWEAHKARNAVAHEGTDLILSKNEAKRIISLYRQVFEEFFYI